MVYTVREDLKTLLKAHTFSGNAALTANPIIIHNSEADDAETTHGKIVLDDESVNRTELVANDFEDIHYRTMVRFIFSNQTAETKLKAIMFESRKALHTHNRLVTKKYTHKLLPTWDGVIQNAEVNAIIESIEMGAAYV